MEVKNISIDSIKPYKNNPRDNEAGVDAVANSIKEFKWQQPIVVDENNVIIVGHTRYLAAKKLGLKEVPVKVATGLTPEQVKAYRLADNKTGELTNWDIDLLDEELDGIVNLDMSDFGFESNLDVSLAADDDSSTDVHTNYLKACGYQIELTDEEFNRLKAFLDKYVDENGVVYGAILELLDNAAENY